MKGPENADQPQLEMLRKIKRRTNIDEEGCANGGRKRSKGEWRGGDMEGYVPGDASTEAW